MQVIQTQTRSGKAGSTWPYPGGKHHGYRSMLSANIRNRWLPYRIEQHSQMATNSSAKNQSGQSWEAYHAGIKSAAISENFRKT